jgi:dTDP-4-dehydrorhamnose 3,5-epimerase
MKITKTDLPEVKIIEPLVFGDDRGFFLESWNQQSFAAHGIDVDFVQDNHSKSSKGVLRGIHYQIGKGQGKLVRVTAGSVFDVAVDLRKSSPRFGRYTHCVLSAENKKMLWIPEGFGHAFLALKEGSEFLYKCTDFFSRDNERAVLWSDPDIAINWPLDDPQEILLSEKDRNAPLLKDAETYP